MRQVSIYLVMCACFITVTVQHVSLWRCVFITVQVPVHAMAAQIRVPREPLHVLATAYMKYQAASRQLLDTPWTYSLDSSLTLPTNHMLL